MTNTLIIVVFCASTVSTGCVFLKGSDQEKGL